jgi:hypothetical protein
MPFGLPVSSVPISLIRSARPSVLGEVEVLLDNTLQAELCAAYSVSSAGRPADPEGTVSPCVPVQPKGSRRPARW